MRAQDAAAAAASAEQTTTIKAPVERRDKTQDTPSNLPLPIHGEYNSKTASCHAIHYYHQPSSSSSNNSNSNSNSISISSSSRSRSRSSGQHQHQPLTSSASTSSSSSSLQLAGSRYALHKDPKYPFELVENEADAKEVEAGDHDDPEGGQELVEYQRYARNQKQRYYGHTVGQRSRRRYYKYDAVEECCRPIFQDQQCDSLTDML
ncbi:GL14666 [Drosophila persimilis]|uniref:GL14666 n=1 Tax=Drosophila persimilis TaxID=7234 RepID=B4GVJ3_DROPE|nr:GL14666 [Drosophila persimilis]